MVTWKVHLSHSLSWFGVNRSVLCILALSGSLVVLGRHVRTQRELGDLLMFSVGIGCCEKGVRGNARKGSSGLH